jgi:hypothetical protein
MQNWQNQIVYDKNKKLPTWFTAKNIYYPPKISIEQTSSRKHCLRTKATLVSGNSLIITEWFWY